MVKTEKTVKLPQATITFRNDGIIHIHYEDVFLTLDDSKSIFNATRENSPWDIAPLYLSGGTFTNQDKQSRAYNASKDVMKHCSAIAFLSPNPGQKLLANFFIKIFKPTAPTRFFNTEEEAINWLRQYSIYS